VLGGVQVERGDLMSAYYRRLTGNDEAERQKCAAAWSKWECSTSRLLVDPVMVKKATDDVWAYAFARIEWYERATTVRAFSGGCALTFRALCEALRRSQRSHYFVHGGWFERERQLLEDAHKIAHIPTTIVQGVRNARTRPLGGAPNLDVG